MKKAIPTYDICTIDETVNPNVLVKPLKEYLSHHYSSLHPPHRHSFYHFVLFTSGEGSHTIDFDRFDVQPYQMYFMSPGQVHSWYFEGEMRGFIVHFDAALFTTFLQDRDYVQQFSFFSGYSKECVITLPTAFRDEIETTLNKLLVEANRESGSLDLIRTLLLQVLLLVDKCCSQPGDNGMPHANAVLIRQFRQLVDKHFRSLRLPKEYAHLLYITPNHLNAVVKDVLGKTAGDIIRQRIVVEAKRLLTNAQMDVKEIAYDLNFEDPSYFTRFFRKNVGTTPELFRKTMSR
jgi:AraC-like DNA-binding protein